jgi:hypothetical protein
MMIDHIHKTNAAPNQAAKKTVIEFVPVLKALPGVLLGTAEPLALVEPLAPLGGAVALGLR